MCVLKFPRLIYFKLLQFFNLALFAKKGWRFLTKPQSLLSRVFKPKYFPNGEFLHSSLGRKSFYVWLSNFPTKAFIVWVYVEDWEEIKYLSCKINRFHLIGRCNLLILILSFNLLILLIICYYLIYLL